MKTNKTLKLAVFFCVLSFMTGILCAEKPEKTMPQPPSGTQPATPAVPTEKPAEPAVPGENGDKMKPENPNKDSNPSINKSKDIEDKKQEISDNDKKTKEDIENDEKTKDKSKTDKDKEGKKKGKKNKGKKGKSPKVNPSLSAPSVSQGAGAGVAGGVLGKVIGIFGGSGDKNKQDKSSQTISEIKPVDKSSATITDTNISTQTLTTKPEIPIFSQGNGPKIAVFDFDGDAGIEFADYLSEALGTKGFKVYNRKSLKEKGLANSPVNKSVIKKISGEIGCEYLIIGKISKKTETLSIISVFLKDGKNADIKTTYFVRIKDISELKSAAEDVSQKIDNSI